jgi:hypothetical protein
MCPCQPPYRGPDDAPGPGAKPWTFLTDLELALGSGPALDDRPDDLRNDVSGFLQHDGVADPDVLPADLIEVVERRSRDRRAGDLDGRQVGDRRHRAGPTDVHNDVLEVRLDLLRRELVGNRPTRSPGDHPESLLLIECVDLHDDAVGLVRQLVAGFTPAFRERDHAIDVEAGLVLRIHGKAEHLEPLTMALREPTLDDVFLTLTGHAADTEQEPTRS